MRQRVVAQLVLYKFCTALVFSHTYYPLDERTAAVLYKSTLEDLDSPVVSALGVRSWKLNNVGRSSDR
jgi:hypothetical protein